MAAGQIQSDINQAFGTAGVLAGLSGIPQARAAKKAEAEKEAKEQQRLDKQAEVTSKAVDVASKNIDTDNPMTPENDAYIDALKNAELARKAQFERNPSESTYGEYQSAFTNRVNASLDLEDMRAKWKKEWDDLVSKQKQAMAGMESKKGAKSTQKRNFMDYIGRVPMYGETVGSIDARHPGFAKNIASQYTKSQRRTLMNRMDREAANGKQQ